MGKTGKPNRRWIIHRNYAKKISSAPRYNYPLYSAIRKYGVSNFTFEVIENFDTEEDSLVAEEWWIAYLKSIGAILYNLTNGGEGISGRPHSEETKRKISESNRGNQNRLGQTNSTQHRANISISQKGKVYSTKRKSDWYQSYYGKEEPNGLSGIEKERTEQSEKLKGELGSNSKLNEQQVKEIKQLIKDGVSHRVIAKMFGVSKSAIGDIGSGRCWSHVKI